MWKNKVKSEKGITLVALVAYMLILTLVIGVLTTISTFFYTNIGEVVNSPKYINEFNKFAMFFATDVKNYKNATVTNNTIEFEDGPVYTYQNNFIYRNDVRIAQNIIGCNFTLSPYTVNTVSKNIINVDLQIGKNAEDSITQNLSFTLRYW